MSKEIDFVAISGHGRLNGVPEGDGYSANITEALLRSIEKKGYEDELVSMSHDFAAAGRDESAIICHDAGRSIAVLLQALSERNAKITDLKCALIAAEAKAFKAQAEVAELGKPVAVERNETLERIRNALDRSSDADGREVLIPQWRHVRDVLSAYDALAQDCAGYANAHDVLMGERKELRERLSREQSRASMLDEMIDGIEKQLCISPDEQQETIGYRISELQECERQLREALQLVRADYRSQHGHSTKPAAGTVHCYVENALEGCPEEWRVPTEVFDLQIALADIQAERDTLRDALTLVLPMAKGWAHEHPVGDNQGKVNHAASALAASPAPVETVEAQHDETGRMWEGPRDRVPSGYSVCGPVESECTKPHPHYAPCANHEQLTEIARRQNALAQPQQKQESGNG